MLTMEEAEPRNLSYFVLDYRPPEVAKYLIRPIFTSKMQYFFLI